MGFGFDIFPVDPEQAAQFGIEMFEDDEEDYEGEDEQDEEEDFSEIDGDTDTLPPMEDDIPF